MKDDLYPDPIMVWAKDKRHEGPLLNAHMSERVMNPLCGDRVTIEMRCEGMRIVLMAHQVRGCLLCKTASVHLAVLAPGNDLQWLEEIYNALEKALKSPVEHNHSLPPDHVMFAPVRAHKTRHSCVLLPYEAAIRAFSTLSKKMGNRSEVSRWNRDSKVQRQV